MSEVAGSYNHCVNDDGKLLSPEDLAGMLENGGDVYEAVEEMYGMIWYLADALSNEEAVHTKEYWVQVARMKYNEGLQLSPGVEES